jgi:hypothetical protein
MPPNTSKHYFRDSNRRPAMEQFQFKRAQRVQARLRLGISAVSGAGKTYGSLRLARGIVQALIDTGQIEGGLEGKIALIDTERKSAALYAHLVPFDTLELEPPYTVDRYQQAIAAAEHAGYVVCIIDQISHAWAGPGGQLEWIDTLKAGARNAMSPWAKVTPVQQEFYDRILRSSMHIIATMRAKSEYVIEEQIVNGQKKNIPRKIGLSPVQREGIEYEFTTCLDIDLDSHMASATKDRTSLFMDRQTKLDEECGRRLAEWLVSGAKAPPAEPPPPASGNHGAGNAGQKPAAELQKELDDNVSEYELAFLELATLPELAAHFDKGQREVRGYVSTLGAEVVKPFLDRLIAAKDKRKEAIQKAAAPAGGDLVQQADPNKLSVEDVKKLESFGANEGLTPEEILEACNTKALADLQKSQYAICTDAIVKAARAKKQAQKPARGRKEKAAA